MVAALVEALSYKPESGEFDSQWGHCDFFFYLILPAAKYPWDQFSL